MRFQLIFCTMAVAISLLLVGCGDSSSDTDGAANGETPSVLDEPVTEENMKEQLDALEEQINAPIEP